MDSSIALQRLRENGIEFKIESHADLGVLVSINKTKNIKTNMERKFETIYGSNGLVN